MLLFKVLAFRSLPFHLKEGQDGDSYMPIVPPTWEAEVDGLLEPTSVRSAWTM